MTMASLVDSSMHSTASNDETESRVLVIRVKMEWDTHEDN